MMCDEYQDGSQSIKFGAKHSTGLESHNGYKISKRLQIRYVRSRNRTV